MVRAIGWVALLALAASAGARTTLLVPVDTEPSWRDLAYLAAIPASEAVNAGGASLVALDAAAIGPEIKDYARRYRAESVVALGEAARVKSLQTSWPVPSARFSSMPVNSAEQASLALSRRFWKKSPAVVLCRADDYASALMAVGVAARLKAPLIYTGSRALSSAATAEIRRLQAQEVIAIGIPAPALGRTRVALKTSLDVMQWARNRRLNVSYLAAVNPRDRGQFVTRKLSMIGAQLAAGRGGLVVTLPYQTEWKRAFVSQVRPGALPDGVTRSTAPAKSGTLDIGLSKLPFILTGDKEEQNLRLWIDLRGDGRFGRPLASGDTLTIDGRTWAVSLGTRTKFGATDVHLTWPTANEMRRDLERHYSALGRVPEHLCLVGFPDALPHAIFGQGGIVEEQTSDLPFAMVGQAEFAQIGVARLIAESVGFGSLYAARALTYPEIRDPSWQKTAGQAEWENSLGPLFENVGFGAPYHLSADKIPWIVPPAQGQEGKRAPSFGPDSPLTRVAVLAHSEHSWWQSLGATFGWDATVLLAPTVVESGGCATATLDREPDNRSVISRLLRLGAVGFSGGSRELPAQAQPLRMAFWNGILAGETLGQAHRRALNAGLLVVKDEGEGPRGPYRYCTQVRMQFGDPALAIQLPSPPRVAPARTVLEGNTVSVYGPGQWWIVKTIVPPDWKDWAGKDLFAVRGPGAIAMSTWSGEGRDKEILLVKAEFTSAHRVKSLAALNPPPAPLGWRGKWYSQANPDGTYTHRFSVRMIDFDQVKGEIRLTVDRMDFRVEFE
jgi:hypothetical protein